ncbi:drug/metabolite transporter (DMT)-like permease [Paraburkholderia sp. BL21I4N1]|nr:drug/metabolite transporter (DMT)-like permease [Paraburkholderia sp. BL21I4N1]
MLVRLRRLSRPLNKKTSAGFVFMFFAVFLFAVADAIARLVSARYPANEITFFRMLFGLVPAACVFRFRGDRGKKLMIYRFAGHFLRAVMVLGSRVLFFSGLANLPLSTAMALQYTDVMFIGLFAIAILSERFHLSTTIASIVGFSGVALVSFSLTGNRGSFLAVSLVLLSAMFSAGSFIQLKKLSRSEEPVEIVFYFTTIATILSGMSLVVAWVTPDTKDFGYMALLGLTAGAAQLMLTVALANTAASLLASFRYFGIVWAIAFEYLIWGEAISVQAALGSGVIVGSALYLCWSNRRIDEDGATARRTLGSRT